MLTKLTEAQCRAAIAAGDFSKDLREAAPKVVLVLTQSWCPQWTMMRPVLEEAEAAGLLKAFYVEYDREAFFEDFMDFKEGTYQNREIPYLRYYRDGNLVRTSNYLDKSSFLRIVAD